MPLDACIHGISICMHARTCAHPRARRSAPIPTRQPACPPARTHACVHAQLSTAHHACIQTGYKLQSSGRCTAYITSVDECNKAAAALSLKDTTASSQDISFEPPGCYYKWSRVLKVNTTRSTASCSSSSECLCKLTMTLAPATTPAPMGATGAPTTISPTTSRTQATGAPTATGE